ncbi:hypothetical protein AGMMS50229_19000 [Campylobacterota bacterium]|nr:hypothetical protein AGMMS50229_19000 [Campylobacterota bacterium]
MDALTTELRWIEAPLEICFSLESAEPDRFKLEFNRLAESDDDPLSQWLKIARARGETKESDPVVLALLIDLHRKIDELSLKITGQEKERLTLEHTVRLDGLNYTHFKLAAAAFETGERYYGRIKMPVFPIRDIGFFFKAHSDEVGEIAVMHERDQKAWDSYVASRERVMIRQQKGIG